MADENLHPVGRTGFKHVIIELMSLLVVVGLLICFLLAASAAPVCVGVLESVGAGAVEPLGAGQVEVLLRER